jgi:flagellar biosynthesis/type III secretory pathway chaperone
MQKNDSTAPKYDSLIDILFAQYSDLESLLALARRETVAVEQQNFEQILNVMKERATLGDRLEVYHRQLAEMRTRLGEVFEPALSNPVVARTTAIIDAIKLQDARTRPLLLAARNSAQQQSLRADQARRNLGAYSRTQPVSVACDEQI